MKSVMVGWVFGLASLGSHAALVTYNISGTLHQNIVGSVETTTPSALGAVGTGSLVFDTAAPVAEALVSGSFAFGSVAVTFEGGRFYAYNGESQDFFDLIHSPAGGGDPGNVTGGKAGWSLYKFMINSGLGPGGNLDGPGLLDPSGFDPALWPLMRFDLDFWNRQGGQANYQFTATSMAEANAVSEPASLALAGMGMIAMAALRRRRAQPMPGVQPLALRLTA